MNILPKPEEAFVPVNQPTNSPTLHLIPETRYVRRKRRACNHPSYHQQRTPHRIQQQAREKLGFLTRLKLLFHHCTDTWSRLKRTGKETVRWLVWRVVYPLSIASALWIPDGNPAGALRICHLGAIDLSFGLFFQSVREQMAAGWNRDKYRDPRYSNPDS